MVFRRLFNLPLLAGLSVVFSLAIGCQPSNAPSGPAQDASTLNALGPQRSVPQGSGLFGGVVQDVLTLNTADVLGGTLDTADGVLLNPGSRVETDSDTFDYYHSEDLWTYFGNYADYWAGEIQIKEAKFIVGKYSVPRSEGKVTIKMTVTSGVSMEDVVVEFEPDGFKFRKGKPGKLILRFRGKDIPETSDGYHIHDPGRVEKIDVTYEEHNGLLEKYVTITIDVPGFSKYMLGGGRDR